MVKVGIIGAGFMGDMHAQVYRNLSNARLAGIFDITLKKADELARRYNTKVYATIEDILTDKQIDMIDICLPTYLHKEYTIKAAHFGKHILCEKPISLTLEDADDMINETQKANVKFMVAHVIRFWPEYVVLKNICADNQIGRLRSITCTRLSPTPTWGWNNWLLDDNRSKGALLDMHIHDTDYLMYLIGKPISLVSRGVRSPYGTWDHIYTIFDYPDGVKAFAEGGWDMVDKFPLIMAFRAVFEKGVVEFNIRDKDTLVIYEAGKDPIYPEIQQHTLSSIESRGNIATLGGYFSEIEYFINCIEDDREPTTVTPYDARNSLELVLKELESVESGREIKLEDGRD